MRRFHNHRTAIFSVILALFVAFYATPSYSQCPPGRETQEDDCPIQPPDMLDVHPEQIDLIERVKERLYPGGNVPGNCNGGWNSSCAATCGAGVITEEVARCIPGARVIHKTWGAGCNSHSFDAIVFPDGYIYDIIISGGGTNIPAWQPICCENLPPDTPTNDGTCPGRWANSVQLTGACIVPYTP